MLQYSQAFGSRIYEQDATMDGFQTRIRKRNVLIVRKKKWYPVK
jgi:hypothetical protein